MRSPSQLTAALLVLSACSSPNNSANEAAEAANAAAQAEAASAAAQQAEEAAVAAAVPTSAPAAQMLSGFASFGVEARTVGTAIRCQSPRIIDANNPPALWQCIGGAADTVKLWVNEADSGGGVRNVKFMWNDWTKDSGYGLHADKALSDAWVSAVALTYAPNSAVDVINTFHGKKNKTIESDYFKLEYTYDQGPGIGERMIIVTER